MNASLKSQIRSNIKRKRDSLIEWFRRSSTTELQLHLGSEKVNPSEDDLTVLEEYNSTLERIEDDEFGKCSVCHSEIKNNELDLDFTKQVCIDCYSTEEKKRLERDLEMAAKVQNRLLPSQLPKLAGFQMSVNSEPAGIVGGDYFDFFCGIDNNQGIVIGDVMGKGLSASMLMANIQASLRILGPEKKKMNELAERLNELFRYNTKLISFISLFLAKLNTNSGKLEYCNAGHNPPIFFNSSKMEIELLKPTGPAIGLTSKPKYNLGTSSLNSGDIIVMYTDGLTESRNNSNEEFGQQRIISLLKEHHLKGAGDLLSIIKNEVKIFSNGNSHDDLTLLVLKRL